MPYVFEDEDEARLQRCVFNEKVSTRFRSLPFRLEVCRQDVPANPTEPGCGPDCSAGIQSVVYVTPACEVRMCESGVVIEPGCTRGVASLVAPDGVLTVPVMAQRLCTLIDRAVAVSFPCTIAAQILCS